MWRFTGRIPARTNGAYLITRDDSIPISHGDTVHMGIVMHSPLRSQNDYDIAAQIELATVYDNARRGRNDRGTARFEYVDTLVNAGFAPWFEPERILMPVVGIGAMYRINQTLRHKKDEANDKSRQK